MPEITREEVRAWLEDCASTMEAVAQLPWLKTPVPAKEARMYRLALAALEDAERYEQAIRWALGEDGEFAMWPGYGEGRRPADGLSPRVGYFWWRTELRQRSAIDRARGAVSEGT